MPHSHVIIPERGTRDIDRDTWDVLSAHADFWRLIEQKFLSVTHISPHKMRLIGSCFVGRIVLDDSVIEIGEKVPGSLAALLEYATFNAFRVEKYEAPASEIGPLLALLVRQFLAVLQRYVSHGRQFMYETKKMRGSLVGGRLDITRTVGLRARGLQHVLAFDRPVLSPRTPKNRIIAAAVSEVERVSEIIPLHSSDLAMARGLSLLFEDCKDAEVLFGDRDIFVRAGRALVSSRDEADRDLIALASVVLAHQSFDYGVPLKTVSPRAWFLNLENLFEVAVRQVLADLFTGGTVTKPADAETQGRVFEKEYEEYKASPDLLLSRPDGVKAVGD